MILVGINKWRCGVGSKHLGYWRLGSARLGLSRLMGGIRKSWDPSIQATGGWAALVSACRAATGNPRIQLS
eukprot:5946233-Pyramimonas_sp.AAC.1